MKKWEPKEKKEISRQEGLKKGILAVVFIGFLAGAVSLFLQGEPFARSSDGAELLLGQTFQQVSKALDFRTAEYTQSGTEEEYTLIMPGYRQTMCFSQDICQGIRWEYWDFQDALGRIQDLDSVLSGKYTPISSSNELDSFLNTQSMPTPPAMDDALQKAWTLPEEDPAAACGASSLTLTLWRGEEDSFFVELSLRSTSQKG